MVTRPGRHAHIRAAQRSAAIAATIACVPSPPATPSASAPFRDRLAHQLAEVVPEGELHRLNAASAGLAGDSTESLRLTATRLRVIEQHRPVQVATQPGAPHARRTPRSPLRPKPPAPPTTARPSAPASRAQRGPPLQPATRRRPPHPGRARNHGQPTPTRRLPPQPPHRQGPTHHAEIPAQPAPPPTQPTLQTTPALRSPRTADGTRQEKYLALLRRVGAQTMRTRERVMPTATGMQRRARHAGSASLTSPTLHAKRRGQTNDPSTQSRISMAPSVRYVGEEVVVRDLFVPLVFGSLVTVL